MEVFWCKKKYLMDFHYMILANVMFQKNAHHVKQGMTVLRIGTEIFGDLIFEKIMQTNMHLKVRKKFPIQPTIFR